MIDLNEIVPGSGTVDSRGVVGINYLKKNGYLCGFFHHNDKQIVVYPDSNGRELCYQYEMKRKK